MAYCIGSQGHKTRIFDQKVYIRGAVTCA